MAYPIEEKLVIAVASSALFALDEADAVFRKEGVRAYRKYQREHESDVLAPGIAFPFVRRFLELNTTYIFFFLLILFPKFTRSAPRFRA